MEGRVDAWAVAKGYDVVTYSGALEKAHVRCTHCQESVCALPTRLLRLGECFSLSCLVRKTNWDIKKDMKVGDYVYNYGIHTNGHCVAVDVGSVSAPYTYDDRFLYAYDYGFLYVRVKRLDDLIPAVQKVLLEAQADEDEPEEDE